MNILCLCYTVILYFSMKYYPVTVATVAQQKLHRLTFLSFEHNKKNIPFTYVVLSETVCMTRHHVFTICHDFGENTSKTIQAVYFNK